MVVREEPGQATNWGGLILGAVRMALKMARQRAACPRGFCARNASDNCPRVISSAWLGTSPRGSASSASIALKRPDALKRIFGDAQYNLVSWALNSFGVP